MTQRVGSICRRQGTWEAGLILQALHESGLTRLHGFGFKLQGLIEHGYLLTSADSMAWSMDARRKPPLPGCIRHRNCANCLRFALAWRTKVAAVDRGCHQPPLPVLQGRVLAS